MSKNLYYTIPKYFEEAMHRHDRIASLSQIKHNDFFLYKIIRNSFHDTITVWLADQYHFTEFDLNNRPHEISRGDYILIARPEASYNVEFETSKELGIELGKLGEFMGALNYKFHWEYQPPTEEEKAARKRKKRS